MSATIKSKNKYICKDKEELKQLIKEEGFIFKNSTIQKDEYLIDIRDIQLSKDKCIRIRTINDKDVIVSFNGIVENISPIEIKDIANIITDISQRDNIMSLLSNLGYYKFVSVNMVKEVYVKKDREYYYSIGIDTIENIGEFVDYDIYSENDDKEKLDSVFSEFEVVLNKCLGDKIEGKYRDYCAKVMYNTILKGEYVKKILVELDKILINTNICSSEDSIKDKNIILNLELIEKLEHLGIDVSIVYSNNDTELVENVKRILSKIGYIPKFINITEIKEIAVRETLIIEKQKKLDFTEIALIILNSREEKM